MTALLACNAELITQIDRKVQTLQLAGFLDYRERVLGEGALITEIQLPIPDEQVRAVIKRWRAHRATIRLCARW